MHRDTCPLLPISYFADMKSMEVEIEEIPDRILTRWNLPAARLSNLLPDRIQRVYSADFDSSGLELNVFLDEDCISFIPTCAVRYELSGDRSICITTCLLSKKAASLKYIYQGEELRLGDGTEASIHKMLQPRLSPFTVTYLTEDTEGRKYQITADPNFKVVEDTRFSERGATLIRYVDREGIEREILAEGDGTDVEDLTLNVADRSIILRQKLEPPVYILDAESNSYIPIFLDLVINNAVFK